MAELFNPEVTKITGDYNALLDLFLGLHSHLPALHNLSYEHFLLSRIKDRMKTLHPLIRGMNDYDSQRKIQIKISKFNVSDEGKIIVVNSKNLIDSTFEDMAQLEQIVLQRDNIKIRKYF